MATNIKKYSTDEATKLRFGKKLREIRKSRGLSQEELAFEAELDRTYIGGIETGKRNVSLLNICKIAKALKISAKDFFD